MSNVDIFCEICNKDGSPEFWERGGIFMCISCADRYDELEQEMIDKKLTKLILDKIENGEKVPLM